MTKQGTCYFVEIAILYLTVVLLLVLLAFAYSKTTIWQNASGGLWSDVPNWSNGVPVSGDTVIVPTEVSYYVEAYDPVDIAQLQANGSIRFYANTQITSGTLLR
jgi:hypothetical protein